MSSEGWRENRKLLTSEAFSEYEKNFHRQRHPVELGRSVSAQIREEMQKATVSWGDTSRGVERLR